MGRTYVAASTQYLSNGPDYSLGTNATVLFVTLCNDGSTQRAIIGHQDGTNNGWLIRRASTSSRMSFRCFNSGTTTIDSTVNSFVTSTVIYGVFRKTGDNVLFYGNNNTYTGGSIAGAYATTTGYPIMIGASNNSGSPGLPWDGDIYYIALISDDIGANGCLALSRGVSPEIVCPHLIDHFWDFTGGNLYDRWGQSTLTNNSTTTTSQVDLWRPRRLFTLGEIVGGAPGDAPTLVSPADEATGQQMTITLDWSDVSGATLYRVQIGTDETFLSPGALVEDTNGLATSTRTVTLPTHNTTYYWRALGYNGNGEGPWMTTAQFSTLDTSNQWSTDPLWASPTTGNFRPRRASPLIDAGAVVANIGQRIYGSLPDVGAYEHAQTTGGRHSGRVRSESKRESRRTSQRTGARLSMDNLD